MKVKSDFKTINLNLDIFKTKPATIIDGLC